MIFLNILFFLIAGFFLVVSGIFLVKSLHKIAIFLGISEFSAAFILMAFSTSIPELFVGISSALQGVPQLSMGNVIGANIINMTLLTGIFILMARGIKFQSRKLGKEIYFMFAGIILLVVLYLIGNSLSRIDGIILVVLFGLNSFLLIKKRKKYSKKISNGKKNHNKKLSSIVLFIISLVILFISSNYVVKYAELISLDLELPEIFVGLFLISIATTLPELVFGINAVLLKHPVMSIGDQTGTIFTNTCLVLGIVAIIRPIQTPTSSFVISGIFLFISALIFVTFIQSDRKLDIYEGLSLIGLYVFFVILQFLIKFTL